MKDTAVQITTHELKQQLLDCKSELKAVLQDRDDKFKRLLNFISDLSIVSKGQNFELDNKLAKLRRQLLKFEDIGNYQQDINDIERTLQTQHRQLTSSLDESRHGLMTVASQLLRVKSLPEKNKRELIHFKNEIKNPFHTVWEYLPKIELLIKHYEKVLELQFKQDSEFEIEEQHVALARELFSIIDDLEFKPEQRDKVNTIQAVLANKIDYDELLTAYHVILSLVVDNLLREKSSAQEFLTILNQTLSTVGDITSTVKVQSDKCHSIHQELNQAASNHIANVGVSLSITHDIDELKQQIRTQLSELQTVLTQKQKVELRDKQQLQHSLDSMCKELSQLTDEVSLYKDKLQEQQKLNLLDPLTQLPNRTALEEKLNIEYQKVKRQQSDLWIAVADIDHFKVINDNFGHSTGDKALQVIAKAIKSSLRDSEFVARYGGEEFVLILPDISNDNIKPLLSRVKDRIKSIPFKFKGQPITVTLSIGAAKVASGEDIDSTFNRADSALYQSKEQGRDKVIIDI
ncbi:GGDEF domain-containing protein [Parashewanella curva]|uniref:diguanylate cyclase n=1 Tax=Parashewanella curva TaxID=2338552 RepID=A0A3L8PYR3_9GAMM|nr:GGDEF domain-containing protein [Parashewanella curva]RLV59628.1 GGDEF domain-containing protein [Parashewanella curva]